MIRVTRVESVSLTRDPRVRENEIERGGLEANFTLICSLLALYINILAKFIPLSPMTKSGEKSQVHFPVMLNLLTRLDSSPSSRVESSHLLRRVITHSIPNSKRAVEFFFLK